MANSVNQCDLTQTSCGFWVWARIHASFPAKEDFSFNEANESLQGMQAIQRLLNAREVNIKEPLEPREGEGIWFKRRKAKAQDEVTYIHNLIL